MLQHLSKALIASLILPIASLSAIPAAAQRVGADVESPLLDGAKCVYSNTGKTNARLPTKSADISVSRRLYTSLFHMVSAASYASTLTCKVDSDLYPVLVLQLGVNDDDARLKPLSTINVYQNGSIQQSYSNVVAGGLIDATLITSNGEDIAIEMVCHSSVTGSKPNINYPCRAHFLEANLYTAGGPSRGTIRSSSPQQRPQPASYPNSNQELRVLQPAPQGGVPASTPTTSVGSQTPSNTQQSPNGGYTPPSQGGGNVLGEVKNTADDVRGTIETIRDIRNIFKRR